MTSIQPWHTQDMLLYTTPDGGVRVEVLLIDENLWLTQDRMAQLFGVDRTVITKHLKNIYQDNEVGEEATSAKIAQVQQEWERTVKRSITYYNLDAIIAVWYRVNSTKATQFRIWSNTIIKEYIIKGFVMDDERLKNPNQPFGKDYFEEQLERIRNIRSSERRFYQKITDIYAQCSIDYNPQDPETIRFFSTVQNKLHRAITGQTAAEIIHHRVDSNKPNLWLTNWKYGPNWPIRRSDTHIAKNYLTQSELDQLNTIVTMYLDYAQLQATRQNTMTMQDWINKLDSFLWFNEYNILEHLWSVSHQLAIELAEQHYGSYQTIQDQHYSSDFDIFLARMNET